MPIGEPPPLHKDAYVTDPNTGAIIKTTRLEAEFAPPLAESVIQADKITRFPTAGLEPFQIQRAEALERAQAILGKDAMTEDVIRAASFIECGRLPDG